LRKDYRELLRPFRRRGSQISRDTPLGRHSAGAPVAIAPRLLASKGCTFETHKGGSGHLTVRRGDRKSQLPMHGSRKELGKGLVNKILKDLGLK
jgi:mRNA interferase HicA